MRREEDIYHLPTSSLLVNKGKWGCAVQRLALGPLQDWRRGALLCRDATEKLCSVGCYRESLFCKGDAEKLYSVGMLQRGFDLQGCHRKALLCRYATERLCSVGMLQNSFSLQVCYREALLCRNDLGSLCSVDFYRTILFRVCFRCAYAKWRFLI